MNTIVVKTTALGQVTAAVAKFLDAPLDEIGFLHPPRKANAGLSVVVVTTCGHLGIELEDDKRLAAGLSKLIDSPVYVEAGEDEDFLDEYVDGECVRRVRYEEDDEVTIYF